MKRTAGCPAQRHTADLCVVGGGLAGLCAAVAAARHGLRTVLMHERPVLGGNASSEIRMWICGARGANQRETGIIEEIALENLQRNPGGNWSIWDSILYEKARFQPNLTLLLNCSCNELERRGRRIRAVTGWQLTTQTRHRVAAELFADCSGDSVLAPLSGAEFRWGREARREFGEDIAPARADRRTMGMSCLLQARETAKPAPFVPPAWAHVYRSDAELPHRAHDIRNPFANFWWIEVGGEGDAIRDTESARDELLKIVFGVWDHIKNRGAHGAENWELDWVGFLPGKRESRRYVSDVILTQRDVRAEGRFEDLVAYGGWPMDDHPPAGFYHPGEPTTFHSAPSPFGIPYRCLYSRTVENLYFAGRNISVTHAALSATRVMATCAVLGQAVGTAAALAVRRGLAPRGVYRQAVPELQQMLLEDDCYLPWRARAVPALSCRAELRASDGDPEPVRNGVDRPVGAADNGWWGPVGGWLEYRFARPQRLRLARMIFDSDLNRFRLNLPASYPLERVARGLPPTLIKAFRLDAQERRGKWRPVQRTTANCQRLVRVPLRTTCRALRLIPEETWGSEQAHVFAFDVR
jgi:hypothetical protein